MNEGLKSFLAKVEKDIHDSPNSWNMVQCEHGLVNELRRTFPTEQSAQLRVLTYTWSPGLTKPSHTNRKDTPLVRVMDKTPIDMGCFPSFFEYMIGTPDDFGAYEYRVVKSIVLNKPQTLRVLKKVAPLFAALNDTACITVMEEVFPVAVATNIESVGKRPLPRKRLDVITGGKK